MGGNAAYREQYGSAAHVMPADAVGLECESCGSWVSENSGLDANGECLICANIREARSHAEGECRG